MGLQPLIPSFVQSAFQPHHPPETAVLKVSRDPPMNFVHLHNLWFRDLPLAPAPDGLVWLLSVLFLPHLLLPQSEGTQRAAFWPLSFSPCICPVSGPPLCATLCPSTQGTASLCKRARLRSLIPSHFLSEPKTENRNAESLMTRPLGRSVGTTGVSERKRDPGESGGSEEQGDSYSETQASRLAFYWQEADESAVRATCRQGPGFREMSLKA